MNNIIDQRVNNSIDFGQEVCNSGHKIDPNCFCIDLGDLNPDSIFTKRLVLSNWVKKHLILTQFHFETSEDLYQFYSNDIKTLFGEGALLSEKIFLKDVETIMQSYKYVVIKERSNQKRGYRGVKYYKDR